MLSCYRKERNETSLTNCSASGNSSTFKLCIAQLSDVPFNDFMIFYGQVFLICEYYNGSRPIITFEKMTQVTNQFFFLVILFHISRNGKTNLTKPGSFWKACPCFALSQAISYRCQGNYSFLWNGLQTKQNKFQVLGSFPKVAFSFWL